MTLPLMKEEEEGEEKKPLRQVDLKSGPLDYKAVALTTSRPPLPSATISYSIKS